MTATSKASEKKIEIFEVWLYQSIKRVKKEVKVTKKPHVENESFRSYCILSILIIKRVNSSTDFA